jgi:putative ABC transport system permease protein
MLARGVQETLKSSGSPANAILIRKGSTAELTSAVPREAAKVFAAEPTVATQGGKAMASPELVVIFQLTRAGEPSPANVSFRGLTPDGWQLLRSQSAKIVDGRAPQWGTSEVMIGRAIRGLYQGAELGQQIRIARRGWTVVGIYDAGGSSLESEVWADADQLMDAARRPGFSTMTVKLRSPSDLAQLQAVVDADRRYNLEAKREDIFYEEASGALSRFIRALGFVVAIFFAFGATLGAMITMYAQVASRVREVGTLRALGFRRSAVLLGFLVESTILALLGAVVGAVCASLLSRLSFSTMNFASFTEIKFRFHFSSDVGTRAAIFALIMGLLGGLFPALRAARLPIVEATKG